MRNLDRTQTGIFHPEAPINFYKEGIPRQDCSRIPPTVSLEQEFIRGLDAPNKNIKIVDTTLDPSWGKLQHSACSSDFVGRMVLNLPMDQSQKNGQKYNSNQEGANGKRKHCRVPASMQPITLQCNTMYIHQNTKHLS